MEMYVVVAVIVGLASGWQLDRIRWAARLDDKIHDYEVQQTLNISTSRYWKSKYENLLDTILFAPIGPEPDDDTTL